MWELPAKSASSTPTSETASGDAALAWTPSQCYAEDLDDLHAKVGPFGCGKTFCCSEVTAEKPWGAVAEPIRVVLYFLTLTVAIHEMVDAGVSLEQLIGFYDNLSVIAALLLSTAFTVTSINASTTAPPSIIAWTVMLSLLQLFFTATIKFLVLISVNSEVNHDTEKEKLRKALRKNATASGTKTEQLLQNINDVTISVNSWKDEKSDRDNVALLKELRSLPFYGIPVLCSMIQAWLLIGWVFYWLRAAGTGTNSDKDFLLLLGLGFGAISIGFPLLLFRYWRNHSLKRLRKSTISNMKSKHGL